MPLRLLHLALIALFALVWTSGCATYSDNVRDAHSAVAQSHPERAVKLLNTQLQLKSSKRLPMEFEDDNVLLLLERATVLQAMGEYKLAARDMMAVDDHLEWLDLSSTGADDIAKYMYSESSKQYRAPAYERLLLNTLNMINFLAMRDFQGAKVEARRFTLLEQFFLDNEEPALLSGILSVGNYLGGAAFEHSGDYQQAARYYSRAYHYGFRAPQFRDRLVDLIWLTGYKPRELQAEEGKEALTKIMEAVDINEEISFDEYREQYLKGDTLIIVQTGLVPWKQATRVPIAQAMSYSHGSHYHSFDNDQETRLNMMVANGVIESVNFPMLTTIGIPADKPVVVKVDGAERPSTGNVDVSSQVQTAYAHMVPSMMVAAITRLMTRVVAGEATEAVVNQTGNGGLGFLAKLAVEGAMNAADKPDTRSWMTLPGRIRIIRTQLGPDVHPISITVGNESDARQVMIREDSLNVVNFSRLR
ncbi:hypothetical protein FIV42_12090 [Persicimonas caeni]|uniref:Uncharacterized protein n=1 Tax=Persicimonas caeni TaxID=2292766 RepID=A0A4Y6PTV4_PERCE|nr:hypothetical protein [Persicimonas caeni]QDG51457.1 hypothetical protein FIV42_12090 [Persicimonas caeni]QED32678.1 hypothetical protein FRD00_12085 [Persicimonas caeni]